MSCLKIKGSRTGNRENTGRKIAVKCVLEEEPDKEGFELTPEDDVVEKAIALFGGEVIEIEE